MVFQNQNYEYNNCSGFLIKDQNTSENDLYILTAAHCIAKPCYGDVDIEFDCSDEKDRTECAKLVQVDFYMEDTSKEKCENGWIDLCDEVDNWVFNPIYSYRPSEYDIVDCKKNEGLLCTFRDWALIKINKPSAVPKNQFGFLEGKNDGISDNTPVSTVHHPEGSLKSISYGEIPSIYEPCKLDLDDGNFISGGSSGAPIFDKNDYNVIGILKGQWNPPYDPAATCDDDKDIFFTEYKDIAARVEEKLGY